MADDPPAPAPGRSGRLEHMAAAARSRGTRVALISTWDVENNATRLLAAVLRQRGHQVIEVYFRDWISNSLVPASDADLDELVRLVAREELALVAISLRASAYLEQTRVLTRALQDRCQVAVLWGGVHPTLQPTECLADADLVLRGEGEHALSELADRLATGRDWRDSPNLCFLGPDQAVVSNSLAPLVPDLDALPFRDYTSDHLKYTVMDGAVTRGDPMRGDPVFQVLASRGCVFRCAYCYNSTWQREVYPGQRWYRTRSPASVVEELVVARERWDYQRVRFDDEVFATDPAWLDEFCRLYPREIGLPFEIFTEPKLVDEVALGRLRDAGLAAVNMGVQTTDRVAGALYDRRSRDEVVVEAARIFHRLGIRGHFQLIWDDPASTDADLARVFELVQSFPRPFDLYLFSLTVFPGSALDQRLVDEGRISRWDVEGLNTRTFFQHRVNLRYPRPVEHGFWLALCVLSANDWVHRPTLDRLARSRLLKRHPWPLIQAAQAASLHKMGLTAARMAWRGELTPTLVRRWLSLERLITS